MVDDLEATRRPEQVFTPEKDRLVEYPFPIRGDRLAYVIMPRDVTTAEVNRLAKFLLTLTSDRGEHA